MASRQPVVYASLKLVSAGQMLLNKPQLFSLTQHTFILIHLATLTSVHMHVSGNHFRENKAE